MNNEHREFAEVMLQRMTIDELKEFAFWELIDYFEKIPPTEFLEFRKTFCIGLLMDGLDKVVERENDDA